MFEKYAEEYVTHLKNEWQKMGEKLEDWNETYFKVAGLSYKDGAVFGYNKANEWQTGEPIKGREIFARNIANCNLLATYFDGAWRNVWNGGIIDFDKITMWRYTGFKNNGEEIELPELKENE